MAAAEVQNPQQLAGLQSCQLRPEQTECFLGGALAGQLPAGPCLWALPELVPPVSRLPFAGRPLAEMVPELKARFPQHAALIDAYRDRFEETLPHEVPGTHELARRLAARGVPLYGLTNFGAEFWARARRGWPIFDLFADVVVSGEERVAKPDPAIFAIAERRFGRTGGELFFTDDNPANVAAARARGWQARLFEGAAGLEAELVRVGLLA